MTLMICSATVFWMMNLRRAAFDGRANRVSLLLRLGSDPNKADAAGNTPLHWAAFYGKNPEVIAILLAAGANVNARNMFGQTPLHRLFDWKAPSTESIDLLLGAGAEVNSQDEKGATPLFYAVFIGSPQGVRRLLESGADVDVKDYSGKGLFDILPRITDNNENGLERADEMNALEMRRREVFEILRKRDEAKKTDGANCD